MNRKKKLKELSYYSSIKSYVKIKSLWTAINENLISLPKFGDLNYQRNSEIKDSPSWNMNINTNLKRIKSVDP